MSGPGIDDSARKIPSAAGAYLPFAELLSAGELLRCGSVLASSQPGFEAAASGY